jgi:hypothetical protein
MNIEKDTLEYWENILEEEWFWNIDNWIYTEIDDTRMKINWIVENIDDIEDNIDIVEEDGILKFYFDTILVWIIEYSEARNHEIYIDMIWNINADLEDFEKYDFKERYNFEKHDIKIKWLIYFMYENFFTSLKKAWYNIAFWAIENNNLYHINDELVNRNIIKKSYTRKNKYNKEELVREF